MDCSFTMDHYEDICKLISKSSYKNIFFNEEYNPDENILILRHDVDQSLENSLKMAKIEKSYKLKSTYFIWLTSPFYNIFEKYYSEIIHELLSLGHQIGLHFDEKTYNIKNIEDLNIYINLEVKLVEQYFKTKIFAVSMHKPSKWILEENIQLDNYINVYNKKYFEEFKYISDSRMEWQEECICQTIKQNKYRNLHILIHPFSWIGQGTTLNEKIIKFLIYKMKKTDEDLSKNISVYEKLFNERFKT